MTFTHQQIREAYRKLPPGIQDLVMDNETSGLISSALKETGLNEEQQNLGDSEVLYALYCLQSLDDAINNITKLSGKNSNDLSKLKSTIQTEILDKYKIDIKDFIQSNNSSAKLPLTASSPETKTKDEVKEELIRRREGFVPQKPVTLVPEVKVDTHPMIEAGQLVHDVVPKAQVENTPITMDEILAKKVDGEPVMILDKEAERAFLGKDVAPSAPSIQATPVATPTPPDITITATEVPKPPQNVTLPDYRYDGGKDPYREPMK